MHESLPETAVWSFPLVNVGTLRLRLHGSFLIAALAVFYLGWLTTDVLKQSALGWSWAWSVALVAVWLASVVWHEFGHRLVASRLNAASREIVLTPVGGSLSPSTVTEPQNDLVLLVAGPLANLVLVLLAAVGLTMVQGSFDVLGEGGRGVSEVATTASSLGRMWKLIFWVNWGLVLVNLIPAFPFDGGRILRAALHLVTPQMPYAETLLLVSRIGRAIAAVAVFTGLMLHDRSPLPILPGWVIGIGLGMVIYFASRRAELARASDDQEDLPFGYDFSAGYTSLGWTSQPARSVPTKPNLVQRWWTRRLQQRTEYRLQREADEDLRVDELLQRVHEHGYQSLTVDEQRFLRRASVRYRRKSQ